MGKLLKVYFHLERQGLFSNSQRGFMRGKFCLANLIVIFENMTKSIDEGRMIDVFYIDFSKVSSHSRLAQKVR